jgi:hypothetical protein
MKAKELADLASSLLEKKGPLNTLHQEVAENFYPERADFTVTRSLGDDFMSNVTTSYPIITRRDLGNQIGSMLRPKAKPWFHVKRRFSEIKEEKDNDVREALERFENTQRRAMYDPQALLNRAAKAADHDFAAFGQFAMSIELNRNRDALLYRTWHLRDMAWSENADGQLGFVCRKWKPYIRVLADTFGEENLHQEIQKKLNKDPLEEYEVLHMVVDAEMYDDNAKGRPRWSIWWDPEHKEIIEAVPIHGRHYIVPRWNLVGSQYAFSPAVVAALPDARLIQAMAFTMLEVSEKAAQPPMIATVDAVRSDLGVFAGGITWVDKEYDEKLGEALRPISQDFRGVGYGMDMLRDTRAMIKEAFFLNKLTPFNPSSDPQMTAFQAGQLVQEYIRNALPIFEPMEQEYNSALCEETFDLLMRNGAFGSPLDWPTQLQNMDIEFQFESPLNDVIDQQKTQKWLEAKALLADAISLDQSNAYVFDSRTALRDALAGTGVPAEWLNNEAEVEEMVDSAQQKQEGQDMLGALEQGSEVASNLAGVQEMITKSQG